MAAEPSAVKHATATLAYYDTLIKHGVPEQRAEFLTGVYVSTLVMAEETTKPTTQKPPWEK
jgi:4'-phosphopantetheinyl transferase EntD